MEKDEDSIKNAFTSISSSVGEQGLRGLVNNAGVNLEDPLEFFALSGIRKGLEVNLIGPIILIQTFLRTLLYSEDMSDGQVIDKKLRVVNPFKEK